MTNNQAEIFAIIKAAEIAAINNVKKLIIFTDSRYVVDQFNERLLDETNPRFTSHENHNLFSITLKVFEQFNEDNILIKHIHGHTADFGNLEADYNARRIIEKYLLWEKIIGSAKDSTRVDSIAQYVATYTRIDKEIKVHRQAISGKKITSFNVGDIVVIGTHNLSAAGYGLTRKFFPRYQGEYQVIRLFGSNCYIVQDIYNENNTLVTNIRQLILIRQYTSEGS
ncbi:hypothetical protein PGB90_002324 [Kerria lacca]